MTVRILHGDCREVLPTLAAASVQCVVTSPPYWGLREYGTATWHGGNITCDHAVSEIRTDLGLAALGERYRGGGKKQTEVGKLYARGECPKCGALRIDRQIGLERTPDAYVAALVDVFHEVHRVLRDDGTVWLNIGDCYATGAGAVGDHPGGGEQGARCADNRGTHTAENSDKAAPRLRQIGPMTQPNRMHLPGMKPKDLLLMPSRVALALQADGWWVRSDIIWHKPNPMPESVTDRPTSAHEHVFLLAKAERYFFDAEAVKEQSVTNDPRRPYGSQGAWQMDGRPVEQRHGGELRAPANRKRGEFSGKTNAMQFTETRNIRNVWTIATNPYPEAHFATFPPELAERCIKAGSRTGDTILDPFAGAFTTGLVADRLRRDAVGIELNGEYVAMAQARIERDAGMFAEIAAD